MSIKVLTDTIKVVIDYTFAKKGTKKNIDTGSFKLIYKGDKIINVYDNFNWK